MPCDAKDESSHSPKWKTETILYFGSLVWCMHGWVGYNSTRKLLPPAAIAVAAAVLWHVFVVYSLWFICLLLHTFIHSYVRSNDATNVISCTSHKQCCFGTAQENGSYTYSNIYKGMVPTHMLTCTNIETTFYGGGMERRHSVGDVDVIFVVFPVDDGGNNLAVCFSKTSCFSCCYSLETRNDFGIPHPSIRPSILVTIHSRNAAFSSFLSFNTVKPPWNSAKSTFTFENEHCIYSNAQSFHNCFQFPIQNYFASFTPSLYK